VSAARPAPAPQPASQAIGSPPATGAGRRDLPADDLLEVRTIVRRVIGSRVRDRHLVDDLVQETLTRVLSSWERIEPATLIPYAISTARNVVASTWRQVDTTDRNLHRVVDLLPVERPEDVVLDREASEAVAHALTRLSDRDRDALLAHDVEGRDLASLARDLHTSSGALAAQLKRTRARLRVEYLLAMDQAAPPSASCRPVLLALSGGDRRRQHELDVAGHLLGCAFCAELGQPLAGRSGDDATTRIAVATDADVVLARQTGRDLAADLGFGATDGTVIATAISEVTRNIVKFAGTGEVLVGRVDEPSRCGLRVVARDAGPGIPDVGQALVDGHSTYGGLGLGLPGCRRLMDDFEITSGAGRGTTVTMHKWRSTGRTSG
jgi:serine/threonine-protein kinase RsbT